METPEQAIKKQSAQFTHKIFTNRKPKQICDLIRFPRTRKKAKFSLMNKHIGSKFERTTLFQCIKTYNSLPDDMKTMTEKEFKKKLPKIHITPD